MIRLFSSVWNCRPVLEVLIGSSFGSIIGSLIRLLTGLLIGPSISLLIVWFAVQATAVDRAQPHPNISLVAPVSDGATSFASRLDFATLQTLDPRDVLSSNRLNLEVQANTAIGRRPKKVAFCSTTQVADFTRQIVGDRWEVICVLAAGQDPHTYEVGSDDLVAIQRADLCIQNGWHLEGNEWMQVLAEKAGKRLVTCVESVVPLRIANPNSTANSNAEERYIRDPHAWFDVRRAMVYVENILVAVCEIDPEFETDYRHRADAYLLQLYHLDGWIKEQVNAIPRGRRVLVTHHDAFGYFCEAYGFRAVSPLGWTTGELVDVTINQRQTIIREIRRLGIKSIFIESSLNAELLTGIARDAGVEIGGKLYSDAMGPAGSTADNYLGMMRENVAIIVEHLR